MQEYLPSLQERQKCNTIKQNLSPGDIVLIMGAKAPRNSWVMGRVISTTPDAKGLVRHVLLKTKTNIVDRSVDKQCLLCEAVS